MNTWLPVATLGTALGCGTLGGAFFAFSTFVMKALAQLPSAEGIRAMQSINVVVINRWFLGAFLGTAAACALLALFSAMTWSEPGAALRVAGCLTYLVGALAVTRAFNIPRNDALAKLDPEAVNAGEEWQRYVGGWTAWNHVRTALRGRPAAKGLSNARRR
jgi:uncharacterized membrane protein